MDSEDDKPSISEAAAAAAARGTGAAGSPYNTCLRVSSAGVIWQAPPQHVFPQEMLGLLQQLIRWQEGLVQQMKN